jgi:hypothetical protein
MLLPFMLAPGCTGPSNPPAPTPACSVSLPNDSACGSGGPSYASDVAPLVKATCLDCHFAGNRNSTVVLETAAQLKKSQGLVEGELYRCDMPPADGTPLDDDQRQLLLQWLVCGAPDN